MPQLMPLSWVYSSLMIFVLLIVSCVIYSGGVMVESVKMGYSQGSTKLENWCW